MWWGAASRPEPLHFPAWQPKLVAGGAVSADFRTDGPSFHGIDGLVNLFEIESPGLTSALTIGEYVANILR